MKSGMADGVLLDIEGVLLHAGKALPGAADAVGRLRAAGLPLRFLTNSTRKPRRRILADLHGAGIEAAPEDILTPATPALAWLKEHKHRPHLLVHPALREDFADAPGDGPPALIMGDAGEGFTYATLNDAFRVLADGAPFLALADNRVFRDADGGLSLDMGAFVRALEYASDTTATVLGKPASAFFLAGAASMGCAPGATAMIGDDAEADVAGALRAGIGTGILVRTGKYREGDESRTDPAPSAVAGGIGEAVALLLD